MVGEAGKGVVRDGGEKGDAIIHVSNTGTLSAKRDEAGVPREGMGGTVFVVGTRGNGDGGGSEGAHRNAEGLLVHVDSY